MKRTGRGKLLLNGGVTLPVDLQPAWQEEKSDFTITCEKHGSVDIKLNWVACTASMGRDKLRNVDVDVAFLAERH